jgi:uridine phosphorylase
MKSHIQVPSDPARTRALVCGSPERAALIAEDLSGAKVLAKNREYHTYAGDFQGVPLLVTSHGVGAAGAAICFNELIDAGITKIIRLGTAGGLTDDARIGGVVVAEAAVRNEGLSRQMIPVEYPAIANRELTTKLVQELQNQGWSGRSGIILTSDLFYPGVLESPLKLWQSAGIIAVEMECSALFVIGSLRKIQTAAVLVLDGNPLKWKEGDYNPDPAALAKSVELAMKGALRALL